MKNSIEELLQAKYWIIDILPKQVPKNSTGQFFDVEGYFLEKKRLAKIKQRHINLILKLNCYMDISLDDDEVINPDPYRLEAELKKKYHYIRMKNSMILSEPDDVRMTLFNPDEELLELVKTLAAGEGLFVWNIAEQNNND